MGKTALLTTLLTTTLTMLAGPSVAFAADSDALAAVAALEAVISEEGSTWPDRWAAYREAKDAIDAATGADKEAAEAAYKAIQADVATAIRRDSLPVSGWLMGFFGATLLWGGLAFCIGVARKSGSGKGGG